jgi:hypothetical protein
MQTNTITKAAIPRILNGFFCVEGSFSTLAIAGGFDVWFVVADESSWVSEVRGAMPLAVESSNTSPSGSEELVGGAA